jgi:hypothetical protein
MTRAKHNPGAWLLGVGLAAVTGCGSADDIGFGAAPVAPVDGGMQAMGTGGRATMGGSGGAVASGGALASGGSAVSDAAPDAPVWVGRACTNEEQCPPGQTCLPGGCAQFCRTDADCFDGYRCGVAGPQCPPDEPACTTSVDPLNGRAGQALVCLRNCRNDDGCGDQAAPYADCCYPFNGEYWTNAPVCDTDRRMCVPAYNCTSRNVCVR